MPSGGESSAVPAVSHATDSIWDHLLFRTRAAPDRLAVFGPAGPVTYGRLVEQVAGLATTLLENDWTAQSMIGILMPTSYLHLLLILALDRLSVPSVSLPMPIEPSGFPPLVTRYGLTAIIAGEAAPTGVPCPWMRMTGQDRPDFAAPDRERLRAIARPPERLLRVLWSSGTSGGAKGSPIPRRLQMRRFADTQMISGLSRETRYFAAMKFSSASGYRLPLAVLGVGGAVVLPGDSGDFFIQGEALAINFMRINAAMLAELVGRADCTRLAQLRLEISGSHLPGKLVSAARAALTPHLWSAYGATEASQVALGDATICLSDSAAVGSLVPGVEAEIVDAENRRLVAGSEGMLRLRGNSLVEGYFRNDAATRENFRDGWFFPGDVASIAPGGLLRILGRIEDVEESGTQTAAVESFVSGLPGVREAALFVWADPNAQAQRRIALVLDPGTSAESILAEVRSRFGDGAPVRALLLDRLPRNENGKVLKRQLAAIGQGGG